MTERRNRIMAAASDQAAKDLVHLENYVKKTSMEKKAMTAIRVTEEHRRIADELWSEIWDKGRAQSPPPLPSVRLP